MSSSIRHDAPIHLLKDDKLGRSGFARRVAISLFSDARTKESSVIALCGKWGDGKTSAKNLIKAAAEEQAKASGRSAPNWVEFSPWQVTGLPSIEALFFDEIGVAIGKAPGKGSSDDRVRRWKRFGTSVQAIGGLVEQSAGLVDLAAPGMGSVARLLAKGAKKISSVSQVAVEGAEISISGESLSTQKTKLRQLMLKLETQIVIVIDDMDRLGDDEVMLVLRLIKANADFPNLTFLLLFQRDIVERAVHRKTGEDGAVYLEKFVQVFLELPRSRIAEIHKVVSTGIDDLIGRLGILGERFEAERFANLWHPGLSRFFASMRDAYRYLNVIEFRMAGLVTRGVPEVNMLDVFAMEALRLFEPDVHNRVLEDADLFIRAREYSQRKDALSVLEEIVKLAKVSRRDAVQAVLKAVFPAVSGMGFDQAFYSKWETQARICCESIFERFYAGELGDGMISEADVSEILACQNDRKRCIQLIRKQLARKGTAALFLERLAMEDCFKKPTVDHGLRLALWDTCDEFPARDPAHGHMDNNLFLMPSMKLNDALRQVDDLEEKRKLVIGTMFACKGVAAFVWAADGCETYHEKIYFWPKLSEAEVDRIKTEARLRLQRAARSGFLLESDHSGRLIWGWLNLDAQSVKIQVESWLTKGSKKVVLQLLRAFVGRGISHGMESYYIKRHSKIYRNELEKFAPFALWLAAVNRVSGNRSIKDPPEELALFRKAEKRWASGKPDLCRSMRDDDDE